MSKSTTLGSRYCYACTWGNRFVSIIKTLLTIISVSIFATNSFGQLAPVNPPTGGFAIDGGLRANTPTSPTPWNTNQGDWYPGTGGTGGSVFNSSGSPFDALTSGRANPDPYNGNDNIFTNGSKFNDYIENLRWFTNSAPDKNDINNALYHVSRDGSNNQWAFIAGDRLSTSGTSYIDFEFLQGTISANNDGSGTFSAQPLTTKPNGGGRTAGDMIISMEYTNGGTKPKVYVYQWKLSGSTWSYQLATIANLDQNAFAETNRSGSETNLPYNAFGTTTYQQYAFVEAAINITYLINQLTQGQTCAGLSIQTLWIKTKASASSTAALKDFVDPIPVNFNFGTTEITAAGPYCLSDNTPHTLSATPSGGTFSGAGVSNNQFTPSVAGVGTHTITYSSQDGSCSTTTTIQVIANPAVYTLSGNSICASAPGTGTITLSNSQSGVSYQLKKTIDNTSVQSAKTGTGSALNWTDLPAGINYYVTATGASPTSCTSNTGNASITEVANPTVFTLSGNSICASAPGTGTLTLSNSQSGVSYQLKKATDNSSVQSAQSGTGSALTWSSLPAGINYYVTATGTSPTSCSSNTSNASITEVANPTIFTLSGNSICASAPGTGTITLSSSQSGVSYQLKKASDNSAVQSAQSGTGSALSWTSLPAGVNYYVTATGAAPTSCTSNTSNASITEVANPTVFTLSGNAICASDPNTGTITLSNSQSGVSYQLKKVSDNSAVQSAKSGTGSALSWTSLPANVNYYVTATGAAPTSCTSNTGNASISETANPVKPVATYVPPTCTQTTFSVEIASPSAGVYTLRQLSGGISSVSKTYPDDAVGGKIIFSNLVIGKGYSVTRTYNGCTSLPEECGDFSNPITLATPINQLQNTSKVDLNIPSSTTVTAAPNPYNDRIRFNLRSTVSGQGTLELYNMMGQKVKTIYQGYVEKDRLQTIEYSVPNAHRSNLIYLFRVGDQRVSGKLIH